MHLITTVIFPCPPTHLPSVHLCVFITLSVLCHVPFLGVVLYNVVTLVVATLSIRLNLWGLQKLEGLQ